MSSNELHINRTNYVEYFLLYIDGELTPAQSDAVEAFAALHPDLQEELDTLLTTKLDAEPIFFNKEALMADSMKHTAIDESLLLYIDNELEGKEKAEVEKQLQSDSTLQYQHHLLQQTKLESETIPYPNKEELYRKDEHKVRPMIWFRAAAAVFVLVAAGYMWQINSSRVAPISNGMAVHTPVTAAGKPIPEVVIDGSTTAVQEAYTSTKESATENTTTTLEDHSNTTAVVVKQTTAPKGVKTQSASIGTDVLAQTHTTTDTRTAITRIETPEATGQQIINKQPVTITPDSPLDNKVTTTNITGNDNVVAMETDDNKKGTMKGFLRKATRFIERRTGVAATNDDDELLIGAVAIKLK